jgi:hypothetical protein
MSAPEQNDRGFFVRVNLKCKAKPLGQDTLSPIVNVRLCLTLKPQKRDQVRTSFSLSRQKPELMLPELGLLRPPRLGYSRLRPRRSRPSVRELLFLSLHPNGCYLCS